MPNHNNIQKWQYRSEAKRSAVEEIQPPDAQSWCNFVVLQPSSLPSDCQISSATVRKEAPPGPPADPHWTQANTCSYSIHIEGNGRRLRLKQFLYDWAPPATDHPCLWGHADSAFSINQNRVGWLGTDYKGNAAASVILWGTMCEVSVLNGSFSDSELMDICKGLQPAKPDAVDSILQTPFADLCYWAKYDCDLVDVPFGLFQYRRSNLNAQRRWSDKVSPEHSALLPSAPPNWSLDSYCITGVQENPDELEAIYTLQSRDRYLWYRMLLNGNTNLVMPPQKDDHSCQSTLHKLAGVDVYHAWIDDTVGPHDAVWECNGLRYMVQANSAVGFDAETFIGLVNSLLAGQS